MTTDTLVITSESRQLARVRVWLGEQLARRGVDAHTQSALQVAVGELATNSIKHAYGGRAGQPIHISVASRDDGVVIQVEDFAPDEVLDDMGIESEFDLMGLFQGVGLPFRSQSAPVQMPNMIWLYRRPILDYWAEHDETLGAIVAHVLVHEIGHHFGLSDDDMEAIEAAAG